MPQCSLIDLLLLTMFKTNQTIGTKMTKIRIFHKAFENEIKHVATMKMPINKNIDETLEYVFKRTQNLNEAWITENVGFNMLPTVETRSTSCGDIIEIGDGTQYQVQKARCQYKYAGGKRFVMTRKILEVKEIKRILVEKEVQELFEKDINDGDESFGNDGLM